jgi:hypothetical protein
MNHDDDAFDARVRETWRTAIGAVPPTLGWRQRPATRETPASARWPLGVTLAAAAVVAIALGLRLHPAALPEATPARVLAANAADATATLDRNPDFYAWLASPDAEQLALE